MNFLFHCMDDCLNTDLVYINSVKMDYVQENKKLNLLVNTSSLSQFIIKKDSTHNSTIGEKQSSSNKVISKI